MNESKEDVGVLMDYTFDLEFGSENNDFECTVNTNNHVCKSGYFLYYEGSEYGGVIDTISVDTEGETITYSGRTWHGILNSKVLQPDVGHDYLIVNGEANVVLSLLISRMGLNDLFRASSYSSGVNISNYQLNRYVGGYDGIRKMLKEFGAKLIIEFNNGFVELSVKPLIDYSKDEQFDTDQIDFVIKKNFRPINHLICLGKGDLSERQVIHLYTDEKGNIGDTQIITGVNEVTAIYDYPSVESLDELRLGGIDVLVDAWNSDELEFEFTSNNETYDIGDIIGAIEKITGIEVNAYVTRKIVQIKDNTTTISYKVGE